MTFANPSAAIRVITRSGHSIIKGATCLFLDPTGTGLKRDKTRSYGSENALLATAEFLDWTLRI